MSDSEERWPQVAQHIEARISEMRMTKAEVMRASGISQKSLDGYLAGKPIVRADKARGLCAALEWAPDSIDRILAGGEPVVEQDPSGTEGAIMRDPRLSAAARDRLVQVYRAAVGASR